MRTIHHTERASSQLDNLESVTYLRAIKRKIEQVAELPASGQNVADRPDVYRIREGRHWIYYRVLDTEILVLRLVHTRRERGHL